MVGDSQGSRRRGCSVGNAEFRGSFAENLNRRHCRRGACEGEAAVGDTFGVVVSDRVVGEAVGDTVVGEAVGDTVGETQSVRHSG